jgi:hypothetical protein
VTYQQQVTAKARRAERLAERAAEGSRVTYDRKPREPRPYCRRASRAVEAWS